MSMPMEQLDSPTDEDPRVAPWSFDANGRLQHRWSLTPRDCRGTVLLQCGPPYVLPVIFVPGIMGSNLKAVPPQDDPNAETDPVWRLDIDLLGLAPLNLIGKMFQDAGTRQRLLHPDRVAVDNRGAVPSGAAGSVRPPSYIGTDGQSVNVYTDRGWGEVSEGSYHAFLLWLEHTLNGNGWDPMEWKDFFPRDAVVGPMLRPGQKPAPYPPNLPMTVRGMPEGGTEGGQRAKPLAFGDLQARAKFLMPVHACGYNWLASNDEAAETLAARIDDVRKKYGRRCEQVILVTHSMGGLVARRCMQLPGMADQIAGIVHGVMPATGAPVAYRRCKLGMADEVSGVRGSVSSLVIGNNGREITAVFAQAPGALQLLPTGDYPSGWLRLCDEQGKAAMAPLPKANDPYTDIYLRRDRWWGLVREAWLAPEGGQPITWRDYTDNVSKARDFHGSIRAQYHPNTYVYYGADDAQPSFERITWRMRPGWAPDGSVRPDAATVAELGMDQVRDEGRNPSYVGGSTHWIRPIPVGQAILPRPTRLETSYWELHADTQDADGDGTVPRCSGRAPLNTYRQGRVHEQFRLTGFDHEGSYKNEGVQRVSLYAITKIAASAKVPL